MDWDLVIGLEVHAQLKTQSKLFSGAAAVFGAQPNSQTCYIDAGFPGVLPVLNQQAVVMAIQLGLALNADINDCSFFERKNYFYPDLPKGYQISQYQKPIVSNGSLHIESAQGVKKIVHINRAHLEEDAGKSLHELHSQYTGIDLNRAGTALLEIVTEPCIHSAEDAITYLKTLHQLVRFLGICDGNMQEGSFRCDVNLSLKAKGSSTLGTRTELKNLNSFRFIEKAIAVEQARHQDVLEQGGSIIQETRLYNPDTNTTYVMRDKENEHDYRYFPDPDLLPIQVTRMDIAAIKARMPDLPAQIKNSLKELPDLNDEDIGFILSSPAIYQFYKQVKSECISSDKAIINWLKGPYAALLNESQTTFDNSPISPSLCAQLLNKVEQHVISAHSAKQIIYKLAQGEEDIDLIIERDGHQQENDRSGLEEIVTQLIQRYPEQAADYRNGKEKLLAFFVGQVMKQTKGKVSPAAVNELVKSYLATIAE